MILLRDIKEGDIIIGIVANEPVTIKMVSPHGENALEVIYKKQDNSLDTKLLFTEDEEKLTRKTSLLPPFSASALHLKLASEAYRIKLAYLFDPYLAIHNSDIEPLPHQISAVYETMLPKQPLRFVLADDPGAGKTIMTGLYIKELMLRGDLKRCLIVAPGSLTEQWHEELKTKFDLNFEILSNDRLNHPTAENVFKEIDLCIGRLDKLARTDDILHQLTASDWDLIVVDEAHKMSARYWQQEKKKTRRFNLGELLSLITRNYLLLTATPHSGISDSFYLFMSLVDRDRFEFVNSDSFESRHDLGINDFSDLMRRLLKEELLKFDGTPLFPERRAYTVNYSLSDQEMELYNDVTNYVQQEFNRADQLSDRRRVASVGFALTILQRRLASSPEAIYQSIKRRRARLEERLTEERKNINYSHASRKLPDDIHPELYDDELPSEELEYEEDKIIDEATASTNRAELEAEIQSLKILEDKASQVRQSQVDKKWEELSNIIQNEKNMFTLEQLREKLIIFTEHKDTLNYLTNKIRTLLGDPSAVVNIHGGMNMRERKRAEALFKNDKSTYILIATDAAGEGINLQRAHLMVNYDLPWNPNRLEQRFGRIHRIGQLEVCHLWNLVASETREGMVFNMLLRKLETEKEALGGKVFDILGTINFDDRPLRDLLIEAVRYGNDPEIKKRLTQVVSETLDHSNLIKILEQNALVKDVMDENRVFKIREEMERLEAHKIQPCYVMSFFQKAIKELNGTMHKREQERFEITHVPAILRERYRAYGYKKPILSRYERICFEKKYQNVPDKPLAEFIGPGHPLLDTLVDAIFAQYYHTLKEGTILINENDFSSTPKVLSYVETSLVDETLNKDGTQRLVSKKVHFVAVGENGATKEDGYAPYLDYREPSEKELELIKKYIQDKDFLSSNFETLVENFTITEIIPKHLEDTKKLRLEFIEKTENAVNERLTLEVRYWDSQKVFLENAERAGHPNPNLSSAVAKKRADDLNSRYVNRMAELKKQKNISSLPPAIVGCSLVIPQGLLDELAGSLKETEDEFASYEERKKIEKIAMDAVMKIEASLGYSPKDVHTLNLGYDIESRVPEQLSSSGAVLRFIEVKGRKFDQNTITLSINEIQTALNKPEDYILAIIKIHNDKINIKYFKKFVQNCPDFAAASVNYTIKKLEKCDLVVYNIDLVLPLDF